MKKIVIGVLAALVLVALIGGLAVMKKTVKQESFDLAGISVIALDADSADVSITLTDEDKMTVTQYSKKKVTDDFGFTADAGDSKLAIADNSKEVSWFGIKGPAGISYEIKIPKTYTQSLSIDVGKGNVTLSDFLPYGDSKVVTGRGNIDVSLASGGDCKVTGESQSGDVTIDEKFKSGTNTLVLKTKQGNITVK